MSSYRCGVVMFVMCLLGVAARAGAQPGDGCQLPPTVRVDPMLQPIVADLLARSATVRRQCEIFARTPTLRIDVQLVQKIVPSTTRARATARRFEYGLLRVVIEIGAGSHYAELVAHEFEHVVEQIERLDLAAAARGSSAIAFEVGDGMFETVRAAEAGLRAAAEVDGAVDPTVGLVRGRIARAARTTWRAIARMEPVGAPSSAQIGRK